MQRAGCERGNAGKAALVPKNEDSESFKIRNE